MTGSNASRWARVKEVFHAAVDLAPDDQAACLARECGADDELRAEVRRLLDAHARAGDFIECTPVRFTGRRIGRYEIGELIGRGGMGEVYAARDTELGRDVAIKIGRSAFGDARLRREAQHASRLNHPHICTIHEVGVFDGRWFLVMERIAGRRLSDMLATGGLPIRDTLRYGAQVADAIAHAHQHGVIHRDLKPANIVVTPDGRAKVLDFGLSRSVSIEPDVARSGPASAVTAPGSVAGTLAYLAPEILRGAPADERGDIWALGVVLYEMANGVRPFAGSTDFELCASILHEPPSPMAVAVPDRLAHAIEACLDKDPQHRCRDAREIQSALEITAGERVSSAVGWRALVPRRPVRRRAMLAAAALACVAIIVWLLRGRAQVLPADASGRPSVAVMPFDDLTGDAPAWLSRGVQSMLVTRFAETRGLTVVSRERLNEIMMDVGAAGVDRARWADVARRAAAGAMLVGSVVRDGATIRIDAQLEDVSGGQVLAATTARGTELFAVVDQIADRIRERVRLGDGAPTRSIADVSSPSLDAYRLYSEGVDAFLEFRIDAAQRLLERAVGIDPTFADAYLQLALLSGPAGRPGDRRGYLRKAAEHRGRLPDRRRLIMEVELARDQGRFTDAARGLDELAAQFPDEDAVSTLGLQLHTPVVGPLPDAERLLRIQRAAVAAAPTSAYARNGLAYALMYAGRYPEAVGELEAAARLAPRRPGPYDGLGETYLMMGAPDKALEAFSQALSIDPAFAFSRRGRAWTLGVLGRFDEALQERTAAPHLTAVLLARAGRYREASDTLVEAARAADERGDRTRLAALRLESAMLALERDQHEPALALSRTARDELASVPEPRRNYTAAIAELLSGVAEARQGRLDAARTRREPIARLLPDDVAPWWRHLLDGEIALAAGDLDRASEAFARAEPPRKQFFSGLVEGSVLSNDLVFRDGAARVAAARGDLRVAIDRYRQLLEFGPQQKWIAVFDPSYVLQIARLRARIGDRTGARADYARFLDLWKRADEDLPELAEARRALR